MSQKTMGELTTDRLTNEMTLQDWNFEMTREDVGVLCNVFSYRHYYPFDYPVDEVHCHVALPFSKYTREQFCSDAKVIALKFVKEEEKMGELDPHLRELGERGYERFNMSRHLLPEAHKARSVVPRVITLDDDDVVDE